MPISQDRIRDIIEAAEHYYEQWERLTLGFKMVLGEVKTQRMSNQEALDSMDSLIQAAGLEPRHVGTVVRERTALTLNWKRNQRAKHRQETLRRVMGVPKRQPGEFQPGNPPGIKRPRLEDAIRDRYEIEKKADAAAKAIEDAEFLATSRVPEVAPGQDVDFGEDLETEEPA